MSTDPTPEQRRELLRELTQEAIEAGTYGEPAPEMRPNAYPLGNPAYADDDSRTMWWTNWSRRVFAWTFGLLSAVVVLTMLPAGWPHTVGLAMVAVAGVGVAGTVGQAGGAVLFERRFRR
jgi:hypothetical protein